MCCITRHDPSRSFFWFTDEGDADHFPPSRSVETVRLLLEHGAVPNVCDKVLVRPHQVCESVDTMVLLLGERVFWFCCLDYVC